MDFDFSTVLSDSISVEFGSVPCLDKRKFEIKARDSSILGLGTFLDQGLRNVLDWGKRQYKIIFSFILSIQNRFWHPYLELTLTIK